MTFHVLTLFPEMIESGLNHSIVGRALQNGLITLNCINIREYSQNKHRHVDDYPYGGGAGMVMSPVPIFHAYSSIENRENMPVIYMSPKGKTLNQALVKELSEFESLILLCGHYEGVDQRIIDEIVTMELSIGDYVLTGGELAAMVVIDSVSRLKDGVLGKSESYQNESFSNEALLEYPQYTRPPVFMGRAVPEVLLSGHHANVEKWRKEQSLELTRKLRPDLLKNE